MEPSASKMKRDIKKHLRKHLKTQTGVFEHIKMKRPKQTNEAEEVEEVRGT